MRICFTIASFVFLAVCTAAGLTLAADLSDNPPASIRQLPSLGTIEWTVKKIPFVPDGPGAGISAGNCLVAYDGQIYMMGGFIPAGDETTDPGRRTSRWLHRYNPQTDAWGRLGNMPGRREYGRAIVAGDQIYFIGGGEQTLDQTPKYRPHADVFRYNPGQPGGWQTSLASLSAPRTHVAGGYVGNMLVVAGGNKYDAAAGGYAASTIQGITEVFDLDHPELGWQQRKPIPGAKRGWTAAAVVENSLYLLGGITFDEDNSMRKLQESLRYSPLEDQWTALGPPPLAISGWGSTPYQDRYVLAAGGVADVGGLSVWNDLVFAYDTQADRWLKFDNPLPPGGVFNDAGVCLIGDTIYVAGAEGPDCSHFNYLLVGKISQLPEPSVWMHLCVAIGLGALAALVRHWKPFQGESHDF